jgi:2-polyprenyl-3-methyl-5-hydroxy-6-metoxy-1,4-benzoquinol methylase
LGGQPEIWNFISEPLDIVILNLPGVARHLPTSRHRICNIEGDACDLSAFSDKSFDLVFSNSVIEHVGDDVMVRAFSSEAIRVGRMLWIQTPARCFIIEPHTGMPFWWYYPKWLRNHFIRKWREDLPAWTEMVEGTRYIDKRVLRAIFPGCTISTERFLTWPKSYIARIG